MAIFTQIAINRSKSIKIKGETMLNKEREQEIIQIMKRSDGFVSVKELCAALFASESSIRRDLKALEEKGLVNRSYGGAALVKGFSSIVTFNHRTRQNTAEKRQIAKKGASLIRDGSILFLDQSSTAFYLASELVGRSSLTVVTNNIEIMMLLSDSGIRLICSGGFLSNENRNCLIGHEARKTFEGIFADLAFFSVKAISDDGTVTDCDPEEVAVRDTMLRNAKQKILLCDSSKFGALAPYRQCRLEDADVLISEGNTAQHFAPFADRITLL